MHTSSTNLAAAISTSSTGTITSILHKRDLSTLRLPGPRNINTIHPRTRPLREKGCLCPSPTKPKTTTPLLTRFDSRITQTGPTHIPTTPQKGSAPSSYFLASGETGTGARPTPRGSQSSTAPRVGGWEQQTHLAVVYAHKQHQSCCCYINKLYRHYNKHSTQTRSVHTAIARPQEYQYYTS